MSDDILRTKIAALLAATEIPYPDNRALAAGMSRVGQIQAVSEVGTGANITVDIDGYPKFAVVVNETTDCAFVAVYGMTAAHAFKIKTAAVGMIAADGLTLADGSLTIGTDADLNNLADVLRIFVVI